MNDPESVLSFWFGDERDEAALWRQQARWWQADPAFDALIRARFEDMVHAAGRGMLDAWQDAPRACVAWIVLLDQFPRNLYRGTPRAFTYDVLALSASLRAQAAGLDVGLPCALRQFLYLPLVHAEDVQVEWQGVRAFERMADEAPQEVAELCRRAAGLARKHAEVVERFGRYPHRNAILGRQSTEAELAFLAPPT